MSEGCTIEALTAAWGRLLKRPSVGLSDNFFDLGGTPQLAAELVRELASLCGIELSPIMILQAPTMRELASLLANPRQTLCAPILPLKRGTDLPAIFLAHGIGGDASQLFEVARHLKVSNSIYATQAPGIDGISRPLDSVGDMAETYLAAMKKIQDRGPYILIGYSFGGLVMMEIAQRLQAEGENVGFLAMLDSYPHRIHLSKWQQGKLVTRRLNHRLSSGLRSFRTRNNKETHTSFLDTIRKRVRAAESIALRRYQPRFYKGDIYFLKADIQTYFPNNPRAIWAALAHRFEQHNVPGDHHAMIVRQSEFVGDLLTQQLRRQNRLRASQQ